MPHLLTRTLLLLFALAPCLEGVAAETAAYRLNRITDPAYRLHTGGKTFYGINASATDGFFKNKPYAKEIAAAAREANLDPALVHAVIHVESAYRADAVSEKGAVGLMQVLPDTARRFGIDDLRDPKANLKAGTRYLRLLLDLFDQRADLALAAYNAGEGAVLKHARRIPPYPETQRYVPAVLGHLEASRPSSGASRIYLDGTRLSDNVQPVSRQAKPGARQNYY